LPGDTPALLSEGLRLFFPVAASYAVLLPLLWVGLFGLTLPFATRVPVTQWHAHEMIYGVYGAALAGFLTSAMPEWTDTPPRHGRSLIALLLLWLPGRVVGFFGIDSLVAVAAATDLGFLGLLFWFVLQPLIARRTTRHASFAVWLALLIAIESALRLSWLAGMPDLAARLLHGALMVFLIFFSLALSRINVVVINLALDPTGESTPYRPHPGRQNLAAILVSLYAIAAFAFPSSAVSAYLALAAAAAFLDRIAEWFIGTAVARSHVIALVGANAFAGAGFLLIGAAGLGAPIGAVTGLHMLSAGALGLAVLGVFIIAGLRHTGRSLQLPWQAHAAIVLMVLAGLARVLPELSIGTSILGAHYLISAALWSGAFGLWLSGFLPFLRRASVDQNS
jgi:uncharacterized protein involved in response to NO